LIVLDIGLPSLNGIDAARQIRKLSPESKILFVSQESSADVVQEVLALGARGYVVKAHAGNDLLPAVEGQFVWVGSSSVLDSPSRRNPVSESVNREKPQSKQTKGRHRG
jgi:DNA-binding NarL/FixJ family response regulator